MRGFWRPLAVAAVLSVTAAGVAAAQTVTVIKAPPGSPVELVLNTSAIASTTTAADGSATLDVNLQARRGRTEIDANIFVDVCGPLHRVLFVEPGVQGMAVPAECTRREIAGVYIVRDVTTFVINLSGPLPTVRFRQGQAPASWLNPDLDTGGPGREWGPLPTGLVAFGGGGLSMFANQVFVACGNLEDCSGRENPLAFTGGIDIWFTPFLAAEGSFVGPLDVTANGGGGTFRFDNSLSTQMVTGAGKIGIPLGPVRLYGKGGITYYRLDSVTTQTNDEYTITVDGVDQTVTGGTQSWGLKVTGWRWFYGGGSEFWLSKRLAIYGEFLYTPLKGESTEGDEGAINDSMTSILAGIKVRIGG